VKTTVKKKEKESPVVSPTATKFTNFKAPNPELRIL